jgi:1-acyl-sn-glycerol-3-phosphate acyltransferase
MPRLPHWHQRLIMRMVLSRYGKDVVGVHGFHHLAADQDPFIVAINHSTRLEALVLPILTAFYRSGKLVSFIADWNFALVPGVATILRAGECILLVRKPARPAVLNLFRPIFTRKGPAFAQAAAALRRGRSVGLFPEGTTNRHPRRLLRGFDGAARLSLETGCPIVPVGVRFPGSNPEEPVRERAPMEVFVGEPLWPALVEGDPAREQVRSWHERIMVEIGRLSGKQWGADATRRKHNGLD